MAEPALRAMFITFIAATLLGAALWLWARRGRITDALARAHLGKLGAWLFWMGFAALIVSFFFYEDALLNRRIWLYLMLLAIYATGYYALYFYLTAYPQLVAAERARHERRRPTGPAPRVTVGSPSVAGSGGRARGPRRRRAR